MALKVPTTVPKNSPYYYGGGGTAPVKNVPKAVTPKANNGWDLDSINKAVGANLTTSTLGPAPGAIPAPAVGTPAKPAVPGHWITQDYASMIPADWEVTDAEAQGNKLTGEAEAAFEKQLRQAFIDYGGDSSKLGDYSKYIDEPTIQAAQNNKFSQTAQNLAAMTKGLRQQRAALAAKGMTFSGANTNMTKQMLEAKELADYTATRGFLSGADEGTAGLARTRATIADKIAAARQSAANRLATSYPNTWDPGSPEVAAVPPPVPVPSPSSFPVSVKREQPWERALRLRSEAMNKRYGLY